MKSTDLRRTLRWFSSELIVVIAGILIAISLNSWWQGISDRAREEALLRSLLAEFKQNQLELSAQFAAYGRRVEAASVLLELGPDAMTLPRDSLLSLWSWMSRGGTYDPSVGVITSATSSGDIALIENAELQVLLAQWPSDVNNVAFVESTINTLLYGQFQPWLRTFTSLPDAGLGFRDWPQGRHEANMRALLESFVLENYLREVIVWGRILESDRLRLDGTTSQIINAIKHELRIDGPHEAKP